jgi:hypothetical protein
MTYDLVIRNGMIVSVARTGEYPGRLIRGPLAQLDRAATVITSHQEQP